MTLAKCSTFLLLAALANVVSGQATVTIAVGEFYDPRTVNAFTGDVVEFVFNAGTHGVVQTTFGDPCSQVSGGFNSGLVPGFSPNATDQSPVWRLTVTDTTDPIYFYCPALTPSFHCSNGMVGGVNVADDLFSSFSSAAKSLSGTPTQTYSVVLTGVGATATNTPAILAQTAGFVPTSSAAPASSTPTSSSSTTASSSSFTPSATAAAASKSTSSKAAAIGGGVGGAVAVSIIGILLFLLFRKRQNNAPSAVASWRGSEMGHKPDFSTETAYSRGTILSNKADPNDPYGTIPSLAYGSPQHRGFGAAQSPQGPAFGTQPDLSNANIGYGREPSYPMASQPSPPPQMPIISAPSSGQERYTTFGEATTTGAQASSSTPALNQGVDIQSIAKEVAALIVPHIQNVRDGGSDSPSTSLRSLPNPHEQVMSKAPRGMTPAPEYSSLTGHRV